MPDSPETQVEGTDSENNRRVTTTTLSPPVCPRPASFSQAAFNNVDVRRHILDLLDQSDLVTFMRVRKESFRDVARIVYHQLAWDQSQVTLSEDPERRQIYEQSVSRIDCRDLVPTAELWQALQLGGVVLNVSPYFEDEDPSEHARYFLKYDPALCLFLTESLRTQFPRLRIIASGNTYIEMWSETWHVEIATCEGSSSPPDITSNSTRIVGNVDIIHQRTFSIAEQPPTVIPPPSAPSPLYTICERFNLHLHRAAGSKPSLTEQWLAALCDNRCFGDISSHLRIDDLPVTLDVFTGIYQQQIACGHQERLRDIFALDAVPSWGLDDFRVFAQVASTSLVSLAISDSYVEPGSDRAVVISFSHFPNLLTLIRDNLPNLTDLQIAVKGIESAESTCRRFLHPSSLDDGGTIQRLSIITPLFETPLFNTIRCVSMVCTVDADVQVSSSARGPWTPLWQLELHRYIRAQTPARKRFLSVIDFASIGVTSPRDLIRLTYADDGRPQVLSSEGTELGDGEDEA